MIEIIVVDAHDGDRCRCNRIYAPGEASILIPEKENKGRGRIYCSTCAIREIATRFEIELTVKDERHSGGALNSLAKRLDRIESAVRLLAEKGSLG